MATYVGVDVSKQTLDVQLGEAWFPVANNLTGLKGLIQRLKQFVAQGYALEAVVCEASGGYERQLILTLHRAGYPVHLANARKVRNFAKCKGYLAKTDKLDAKLIQEYATAMQIKANHRPICAEQEQLGRLLKRREQ